MLIAYDLKEYPNSKQLDKEDVYPLSQDVSNAPTK